MRPAIRKHGNGGIEPTRIISEWLHYVLRAEADPLSGFSSLRIRTSIMNPRCVASRIIRKAEIFGNDDRQGKTGFTASSTILEGWGTGRQIRFPHGKNQFQPDFDAAPHPLNGIAPLKRKPIHLSKNQTARKVLWIWIGEKNETIPSLARSLSASSMKMSQ